MRTSNKVNSLIRLLGILMLCSMVVACQTVGPRPADEVTITINNSTKNNGLKNNTTLPPFGPDVRAGIETEIATDTTPPSDDAASEEVVTQTPLASETASTEETQADLKSSPKYGEIDLDASNLNTNPLLITEEELQVNTGKTRIALLLPFSAADKNLRDIAEMLRDASLLALFDQRNPTVQITPYDTRGSLQGAAQAAEKAIQDGAAVILGPLLSPNVEAASVIARRENVPMLSFNNRLDAAGKGVYILGNSPRFEVESVLDYAQERGVKSFVVLAPNNIYGNIVAETARTHANIRGMDVADVRFYDSTATDFTDLTKDIADYQERREALLERIEELEAREDEAAQRALVQLEQKDTLGDVPYDAILMPVLNQFTLRTLVSQLSQYEVDQPAVRFLGLSAWDDMGKLSNEPPLLGAWYASHPDQGWNRFARHFKNKYGYVPVNLTSIAYEAVALSSLLAGKEFKPDFSRERLHHSQGYAGIRGLFRLSPLGYAERSLAIKQVNKDGAKVIKQAAAFDQVLN